MSAEPGALPTKDLDLPAVHDVASEASESGQSRYLALSGARLVSLLVAAVAGALGLVVDRFDISGLVLIVAFAAAACAEIALIRFQPERDWYSGRAIAESAKTLAWRFAVGGVPFGLEQTDDEASRLMRERIAEVLRRGKDRITLGPGEAVITSSMRELRAQSFEVRRRTYLLKRTEQQRAWYADKAESNQLRATVLRYALLIGEIAAVVIAAVVFSRGVSIDFAGIVASLVAGGAAWLAIKQHSQLTSAYRVAAVELALQADVLASVTESDWPQAVADAEEAISREHTMWLASRGEEPLPPM